MCLGTWLNPASAQELSDAGTTAAEQVAPSSAASPALVATQEPESAEKPLASSEPIRKLSYAEAISRATRDTPQMASARASVLRAEAAVGQSRSTWLPTLNGVGNYTRLDHDRAVGTRVVQAADSLNLSAQLFVPLVVPARWLETARKRDSLQAARSAADDTRRLAVVNASRAYLSVVLEREALEIAMRAVEVSKQQLVFVEQRLREGVGSRLEQVRAQREFHTNQAQVAERRSALRSAQEALGVATGSDGAVDVDGPVAIPALPSLHEAESAMAQRSDLVALRKQQEVAQRELTNSRLDYLPTLNAQGQVFYQNPPTVNFPQHGWQAQLLLVLPLYDGGKRGSDKQARDAAVLDAKAALRDAELRAGSELHAMAAEVDFRTQAWLEAERSAKLAEESLTLANLAFQEGVGTQIDLIEAEHGARDAETYAAIANNALLQAKLLYRLAAGPI